MDELQKQIEEIRKLGESIGPSFLKEIDAAIEAAYHFACQDG